MKRQTIRFGRAAAMAAALLVSTSGCATKGDLRRIGVSISAVSARQDSMLAALTRQNSITQDTLRRQGDQLFEVRGDVSRQLQQILDQLATLTELTGQNQRTIAMVRDQLEGLKRGGTASAPSGGEAIAGADQTVAPGASAGAADQMYAAAVQQYNRGSLSTAQRAFTDFVGQFGNNALAPDARFYLADILEQQGHQPEALEAFNKIPELHPTSPKVPDALYRMGLLHLALGHKAEGKRFLDRVVNTYPDSNAAGPAREKLREIQ